MARRDAVQHQPRSRPVQVAFGVAQHGGGIGGRALAGAGNFGEPLELRAGGGVSGLVGAGQVRHQPDRLRIPGQRLQPRQAEFRLFRIDAETAHAGVDFQPEPRARAGDRGSFQAGDLFLVVDNQGQASFDYLHQLFRFVNAMQHGDRITNAAIAQFEGFAQGGNRESVCFPVKRLSAGECAVAVGVGLDDGHQRTAGCLRPRLSAVVNQVREGNANPGGPVHEE